MGQLYNFGIYTHCGIDNEVDFDGSFWIGPDENAIHPVNDSTPPISYGLTEVGTMVLLDADHAQFRFDTGIINFTRHIGPKVVIGCE